MSNQIILVTGATGRQGGAVARHLLQRGGFTVYALVRDRKAPQAQVLARQGAFLINGDLNDRASLDLALKGVDGVFSVQPIEEDFQVEIRQGQSLADAALGAGTAHFVYSSAAGAERQGGVPLFEAKFRIEEHLRGLNLPHTILRPVAFHYNYDALRPMIEGGTLSMPLSPNRTLQEISEEDYAKMVVQVFERPEEFVGRAIEVAGTDMTMAQIARAFSNVLEHPVLFEQIPFEDFEKQAGHDEMLVYRWLEDVGFRADLDELKREFGAPTGFESYLRAHGWARS